jgi:hypothetical protein
LLSAELLACALVSLALDHVILAVRSLSAASDDVAQALGIRIDAGGAHPGWGTHNAIARFGSSYLELIAVSDIDLARARPRGARLLGLLERGEGWLGFALRSSDLHASVSMLRARGLAIGDIIDGRRMRPDGVELRWRSAAFDEATWGCLLPFLIQHEMPPPNTASDILSLTVGTRDLPAALEAYTALLDAAPTDDTFRLADDVTLRLTQADTDGLSAVTLRASRTDEVTVHGATFHLTS